MKSLKNCLRVTAFIAVAAVISACGSGGGGGGGVGDGGSSASVATPTPSTTVSSGTDIVLADFEQSTYQWLPTGESWTTTGTAFGSGPVTNPSGVSGYLGTRLVYSKRTSDDDVGTLTSPTFSIQRKYIRFLIGGGNWRPQTSINLLVNGVVVRTAVGMGDREQLDWLQWDVTGISNAQIQIVDNAGPAARGWRHINVDEIIATDVSLPNVIIPSKKYLLLPVKTGATKRKVELIQDGLVFREMDVELSTTPDYWAFIDMAPYTGKELTVRLDSKAPTSTELQNYFVQGDTIPATTAALRPIYHYTPTRGYLADPNDLVYANGEWHMGYQHNPVGWGWDNMTHGHAVSTDLVNWTELPDAITETYQGEAWNGSSVVDVNNTAGFGTGAIVTLYTSAAGSNGNPRMSAPNYFAQSLAYSTDNGRTFKYYQGNPVVPNIAGYNHDPVVFWYAPTSVWVMVVYVDNDGYHILNSPDLKNWVYKSKVDITGTSEVPDLFPLPLDGDTSNMKWVFSADYRQYIVGTFDGSTFTQQYGPFWYGWQRYDLSAALTFNGDPKGRRIMLSNGRTDYPGMPFNRYMNLPSELTLKTDAGVPKLYINPVAELSALRTSTQTWGPQTLNPGVNLMSGITGEAVELEIVFNSASTRSLVEFSVGEFVLSYNFGQGGKVGAGGQWRSLTPEADGNVHIRAYYDRGVWELFCNDGQFYYPAVLTPKAGTWPISLVTKNDSINIVSAKLHQLGSFQGGTSR